MNRGSGHLCLGEEGTKTSLQTQGSLTELSCSIPGVLGCTVLLCHGTRNHGAFVRNWGMLGFAGRREWILGTSLACTSALGSFIAAGQHPLACTVHPFVSLRPAGGLMPGEWALAQRCYSSSVLVPAERVSTGSLCRALFQTFPSGKWSFSIGVIVVTGNTSQHPPSEASGALGSQGCTPMALGDISGTRHKALTSLSCNQLEARLSSPLLGQHCKGKQRSIHSPVLEPGLDACREGLVMPTHPPDLLARRA